MRLASLMQILCERAVTGMFLRVSPRLRVASDGMERDCIEAAVPSIPCKRKERCRCLADSLPGLGGRISTPDKEMASLQELVPASVTTDGYLLLVTHATLLI